MKKLAFDYILKFDMSKSSFSYQDNLILGCNFRPFLFLVENFGLVYGTANCLFQLSF